MKDKEELYSLDPSSRLTWPMLQCDDSDAQTTQLHDILKNDIFLIRLKQMAWKEFCGRSEACDGGDLVRSVADTLESSGLREVLKGAVARLHENSAATAMRSHALAQFPVHARRSVDEPVDVIRAARMAWEQGINEELHAISQEARRPFTLVRAPREINPSLEQSASGSGGGGAESVKFLFDSEDLLETGAAVRNFNARAAHADRYIGMMALSLPAPALQELAARFPELLSSSMPQLGLDELTPLLGSKLSAVRHEEAEALCAGSCMLDARAFMRRGVPPSLRSRVWRVALGLTEEPCAAEERAFARLRGEVDRLDLLTDELFLRDVQTVADDPRFFVFEEELREAVLIFSRDERVRSDCHYQIHLPIAGLVGADLPEGAAAPPCGVQPFLGLATYFAPLCYVFRGRASLSSVARALFCRLWCKLNVLSGDGDTLLTVCKAFERLLLQSAPQLFLHLAHIGLQPLKIAFPWMQLGFVGLLEAEQLLHLWDRLLGYMDPLLLAVAAAAVFVYRGEALLRCATEAEATAVLLEGSRLRIVPLMQMLFFRDHATATAH